MRGVVSPQIRRLVLLFIGTASLVVVALLFGAVLPDARWHEASLIGRLQRFDADSGDLTIETPAGRVHLALAKDARITRGASVLTPAALVSFVGVTVKVHLSPSGNRRLVHAISVRPPGVGVDDP